MKNKAIVQMMIISVLTFASFIVSNACGLSFGEKPTPKSLLR